MMRILNMVPAFPRTNVADGPAAHVVMAGKSRVAKRAGPYFKNIIVGQFRLRVPLPPLPGRAFWRPTSCSALFYHIGRVIGRRPGKKMIRVAAKRIVTRVANETISNWPVADFKCDPMCRVKHSSKSKMAISGRAARCGPLPAVGRRSFDPAPQRAFERAPFLEPHIGGENG